MAGLEQFESFVKKFVDLWKTGIHARLLVETEAGNAFINLRAGLGQVCPLPDQGCDQGRRGGGSRVRRRERRSVARQVAAEEAARSEEAVQAKKGIEKGRADEASRAAEVADEAANTEDNARAAEQADKAEKNATAAEEATKDDEILAMDDSDYDIYTFRYWDNFKPSEAQEAINYIEEKLKQNFKKSKIKDSDQVFKVDSIENYEDNQILVKIKLKKDNWPVELAARNVQIATLPGNPIGVSINDIKR